MLTPRQVEMLLNKVGINEVNFFEKTIEGKKFDKLAALLDKNGIDAHHLVSLYTEDQFYDDDNSEWTPRGEVMDMEWEDFIGAIMGAIARV